MTVEEIKELINDEIRVQTDPDSISPPTVATILDALADLIDEVQGDIVYSQIPVWVPGSYPAGKLVRRNRIIYESQINGNTADPALDTVNWVEQADIIKNNITVNVEEGKIGGYVNGDIVLSGTNLTTFVNNLIRETVSPTYTEPTIVLSSTNTIYSYEIGETISIPLLSSFTQNNAGSLNGYSVRRNGVQISTLGNYTDIIQMNGVGYNYQTRVSYNTGPILNDSMGNPDPTGQIIGGYKFSNTLTYKGYRKVFYGTNVEPTSSSQVRDLTDFLLNPIVGSTFTIDIEIGAEQVVFAYPSTLQDPTSVKYVELADSEISSIFTKTIVNVEGASGFGSIAYKVFIYKPVEAFSQKVTYRVII